MSFIQNIYTGFDTEFKRRDDKFNNLLSVQLAINTMLMLKMPLNKDFDFVDLDVSSNRFYKIYSYNRSKIDVDLIKDMINKSIKFTRDLNNYNHDESIFKLIKGLKNLNIKHIEKDGSIYFLFDSTEVRKFIKITDNFSFKELIATSKSIANTSLEEELDKVYKILKNIFNNREFEYNRKLDLVEMETVKDEGIFVKDEGILVKEEDFTVVKDSSNKIKGKYTRTKNQSFTNDKISVTKVINNYLLAHLTNADLSILSDFEEFKNQMDIVNGSFVTLKKSILIDGVNVIIRDTKLLTPGGKSLDFLSSLYQDPNVNKIKLTKDQLENMDKFLEDNPELFKDYALRDAYICLLHGRFMENFYHSIGGVGIPLTLSTLSTSYIKKY
jgi:hypothetical protein